MYDHYRKPSFKKLPNRLGIFGSVSVMRTKCYFKCSLFWEELMHIKVCILTWWMELSNLVISVDTLDISHDVFHLGTFSLYCSAFWWNNVDNAEKIK